MIDCVEPCAHNWSQETLHVGFLEANSESLVRWTLLIDHKDNVGIGNE